MDLELINNELDNLSKENKDSPEKIIKGDFVKVKEFLLNPDGVNPRILKFLKNPDNSTSNMAKLCGDLTPMKCGYTSDNRFWITPYGGPRLIEREVVPNHKEFLIKKIHYINDKEYYVIELQKKEGV